MAEYNPKAILSTLVEHEVDFVVIGGLAGIVQGSALPTFDVDVAYARDPENLERLADALVALKAKLRGAPPEVPFQLDARTLAAGAHFTFETAYGSLDVLHGPSGAPAYPKLRADAVIVEIAGVSVPVASLDHLIAMKEASGRPKDKAAAMEYRTLSDELRAP